MLEKLVLINGGQIENCKRFIARLQMDDSTLKDIDDLDRMFNEEIAIQSNSNKPKQKQTQNQNSQKQNPKPGISGNQNKKNEKGNEKQTAQQSAPVKQKKRPRKPNMIHLPDLQLDDLPPIVKPNISKSNSTSSFGQQYSEPTSPTNPISRVEFHVNNYLDKRLKDLKNEFSSNLNFMLDKQMDCDQIINNFTKNLLSDVERELKFDIFPSSIPMIPFNVGIDLPKQRINYDSMIELITEFQARKLTVSESLKSYHQDLHKEIHQRNKAYKTNKQQKDEMRRQLRNAKKKGYTCEIMLSMLADEIETVKKRTEEITKKTSDIEAQNTTRQMEYVSTKDCLREINTLLPDLSQKVADPIDFDGYGALFDEEIQDIHKRRISINNNLQEMCSVLIEKYEKKQQQTRDLMRTTISFMPTEDMIPSMSNRMSIIDPNQTLLRAPKKRAIKHDHQNATLSMSNYPSFNREKFTLPLATYLY